MVYLVFWFLCLVCRMLYLILGFVHLVFDKTYLEFEAVYFNTSQLILQYIVLELFHPNADVSFLSLTFKFPI